MDLSYVVEVSVSAWLQIFQILVIIVGGGMVLGALRTNVAALTQRMIGVETELKKLVDVLVNQARQDERITAIEDRMDFVQGIKMRQ